MPKKFNLKSEAFYLGSRREGIENMPLPKYFEMIANSKSDGGWTKDLATFLGNGGKIVSEDVTRIREAILAKRPLLLREPDLYLYGANGWLFSEEEQPCTDEQAHLLILEELDQEKQSFEGKRERLEQLKNKFSGGKSSSPTKRRRELISEKVRKFVWQRDEGKCRLCGSREYLEFDHIVPFSEGGSNTERNIQLLCEPCNRSKSAKI